MSEEQSEAAAIESIKSLVTNDSFNIGQAEETEDNSAKPEAAAETKENKTEENQESDDNQAQEQSEEGTKTPEAEEDEEIEIKGEKYKVPKAIKESIMLQADYTKKTMALAEERRAFLAEKGQIDPNIAQKLSHYERLLGSAIKADQETDWVKLLREDPVGYLEKKELAEARAREWQTVEAKQRQEFAARVSQAGQQEWEQLIAKRPDLKTEAAFKAHDQKVRTFLGQQGYSNDKINEAVFDHRVRLLVEDAMKYQELQKAKTETVKKIEKLPLKVERPGVSGEKDSQGAQSAMNKLRNSGKVDDAAEAIRALMG